MKQLKKYRKSSSLWVTADGSFAEIEIIVHRFFLYKITEMTM